MASSTFRSLVFLLHWIIYFYVADISCSLVDINLTSGLVDEIQHYVSANNVRGKSIKRREALGDWCVIPPPMTNGKYRPSTLRCPPGDTSPACQLLEGAFVFPDWVIYVDYCDPGYVVTTVNTVAVCSKGRWLPKLPTCGACPQSDTLVNSKTVCRGDVIFEDTFSGPLSDKWKHRVDFGLEDRVWKFNEFTADKRNSFTNNGNLVIKPTVHHEAYLTSGTVELDGCTGTRNSTTCVRTASSDKLLPPIATAIMTTIKSFKFTYGQVEIRAKLPKGDWLVPELYLESSSDLYGGDDSSGRVRIGLSFSNSDLQCKGEDFGIGRVEYRVTMGPSNNTRYKQFVHNNLSKKWRDDYHNYTFIWTPSSLVFKIDNEWVEELAAGDKTLCDTYNSLSKEDCSIYSKGSKMAPFDKDFFVGLGLTAGDLGTGTDGCINRGKVKPWKFDEPEAILKFWQDRNNWLSTWTEDGSSLYIDYVRVTAV